MKIWKKLAKIGSHRKDTVIQAYDSIDIVSNRKVELNDRKIKITFPEKSFEYYDTLKDKEPFQSIFSLYL